jgi:hypothetical protein
LSEDDKAKLQGLHSAYDFYKVFSPDSWINEVVNQTRLYAVQKDRTKQLPMLTKNNIRYTEKIINSILVWYSTSLSKICKFVFQLSLTTFRKEPYV